MKKLGIQSRIERPKRITILSLLIIVGALWGAIAHLSGRTPLPSGLPVAEGVIRVQEILWSVGLGIAALLMLNGSNAGRWLVLALRWSGALLAIAWILQSGDSLSPGVIGASIAISLIAEGIVLAILFSGKSQAYFRGRSAPALTVREESA
ncbi:hypothetical protein [Haliangium ochraceum]|uniref:Uncharacterized protein n=1 Tax=Haliangium ochraceum (strain DSM 14365 / JCM 11303 / SMP-2) TaxID=502025 RepID=D0LWM1_HALO1|nr:hypothetical protein [Haliangium ochraceum]ACY17671.1 hypothetical protein Hoch_5183 [Haliangium ochraceum DSM 14365]